MTMFGQSVGEILAKEEIAKISHKIHITLQEGHAYKCNLLLIISFTKLLI